MTALRFSLREPRYSVITGKEDFVWILEWGQIYPISRRSGTFRVQGKSCDILKAHCLFNFGFGKNGGWYLDANLAPKIT